MRVFLALFVIACVTSVNPAIGATITASGADSYNLSLDQDCIREAIIDLLTLAKKDYILDSQSPGPDAPGAPGTLATMRITNASLEDALRILVEAGSWSADPDENGRYIISWAGEPPPPSRVKLQKAQEAKGYIITIAPNTSQEMAIREIGPKLHAHVFVDATASRLIAEKRDSLPTVEGTFTSADAEQAVRYIATPTFAVHRDGSTIVVSAPDFPARCACGQALDKTWKFCPACGKLVPKAQPDQ